MKIEVDLNQILSDDDYGSETLQESIRRQVVEKITSTVQEGIGRKIDAELSKVIDSTIRESIKTLMPDTIATLMDTEYVCVDRYGNRNKEPTTFRKQLVKAIHDEMTYKKTSYSSDRNAFTKAVDDTVSSILNEFKKDFDKLVNQMFVAEAMQYAKTELAKKLGVKA